MSITRTWSVFCDVEGPNCTGWIAQTTVSAAEARREAKLNGWRRLQGQDVCVGCFITHGRGLLEDANSHAQPGDAE